MTFKGLFQRQIELSDIQMRYKNERPTSEELEIPTKWVSNPHLENPVVALPVILVTLYPIFEE